MKRFDRKLWTGLVIMALLSPLGVILPERWKAGNAWGEWDTDTLQRLLGFVPEGLKRITGFWSAPIRDYNFGTEGAALMVKAISYIISGVIGLVLVALVMYLIARLVLKK
ncbi:MAG: hypothetical protein PHN75_05765 [Syntrophales bacterium]|nr:hypothetical protein [Syntrophales bacterium]